MDMFEEERSQLEVMDKRRRDRELVDIRNVISSPSGRRLLWRILSGCHLYSKLFSPDQLVMAYNTGRHAVGIELLADLDEAKPGIYHQMSREAVSDAKSEMKGRQGNEDQGGG
ncbi:MAG: hypothetical protein P4N59_07405 [Negativicutes bacterium]|nr:hypothetical protein [Negativicutes bacterium]